MTALFDLIARLEAAKGPSRELDALIADYLGIAADAEVGAFLPHFTRSLDDALWLVPEGWASASITDKARGNIGYVHNNKLALSGRMIWHEVRHPCRAIALVIAALKARTA